MTQKKQHSLNSDGYMAKKTDLVSLQDRMAQGTKLLHNCVVLLEIHTHTNTHTRLVEASKDMAHNDVATAVTEMVSFLSLA